ncbi:HHL013Cp [Eremothecium sinecaudum]|uniref:HHL013Cp n=1 Tax=Eremothecium sinecaudum TaxID=45286 RepID=A0A120K2V9_9SACH|nr:HHL013Cp [Eremothecium sinecaudum]AMD22757.1 HHL013Cp [Eremothecium sinecaudum]
MSYSVYHSQLTLSRPYLTKEQIRRAQKNTIPDRRTYNQKRISIFKFLCDICVQLRFPRKTLEVAMYFYQRYYVFNKFETEMCYDVATSCLFIGCKQVETVKKVADICTASLKLRNNSKITSEKLDNYKTRIIQMELRILETCAFDHRINNTVHIDEYIVKIGRELSLDYKVCHLAWLIAFDVIKLEILLIVPQHSIALAALKIACELMENQQWPSIRYNLFESDELSVNEAYNYVINFFINVFDLCDLKNNYPEDLPSISIETFIKLKANSPEQKGLRENPSLIEKDKYLTDEKDYKIRERRYVLDRKRVLEEAMPTGRSGAKKSKQ